MRSINMSSIKLLLASILVPILLFAWGASRAEEMRIVVISHGQASDPFWAVVKNGVDQAAKDFNVKVDYRAPGAFDMVVMSQLIDAAVASKPDGLVVSLPDPETLAPPIQGALDAGIPVVSMNSGSYARKQLGTLVHVGQDEYEAGLGAGKRMQGTGVNKGLCINHEKGNIDLDLRCKGFADGLGGEVDTLAVSTDPIDIRLSVANYLKQNPSIDGIIAIGPLSAEPTLEVLEQEGLSEKIQLATFDLSPITLKAIAQGKMAFAVDQQQYLQGYLPIVTLIQFDRYGLMPGANIQTGPAFVTKGEVDQIMKLGQQGIR